MVSFIRRNYVKLRIYYMNLKYYFFHHAFKINCHLYGQYIQHTQFKIKTHSLKLLSDGSRLEDPRAIMAAIEKSVAPFDAAMLA